MNAATPEPPVTICVLTYGDHADLAKRSIGSILTHLDHSQFRLVVGANAVCEETEIYLQGLLERGVIVRPVANYGMPDFLRISVGTPAQIEQLFAALDDLP